VTTVLRRIFGRKRDEVTREWKRPHNEELYALFFSPSIIRVMESRRMRWVRHVARMGRRGVFRVLVGKPKGRRPLGRTRRRWEDNIKMDGREVAWNGDRWRALVILSTCDLEQWFSIGGTHATAGTLKLAWWYAELYGNFYLFL
jgi:hypothetical protein